MCGIFGGASIPGKQLDSNKLEKLALYNIQRGVDGCGYYYNGYIDKGVKEFANIGDYLAKNIFMKYESDKGDVFLGHTRKSTGGLLNETNTHPHVINEYVQTHNGVIKCLPDLRKINDVSAHNDDIDSIVLARCIQKNGWQVLNTYIGYAALATTIKDSGKLFLYHGASKETEKGSLIEERPLFLLEAQEGIYYSSIEASLMMIREELDGDVFKLPHNAVYCVEDGVFINEPVYTVKRENMNITYTYRYRENQDPILNKVCPKVDTSTQAIIRSIISNEAKGDSIEKETFPKEAFDKDMDIYYRYGRFFMSRNLKFYGLNGKYIINRDGQLRGHSNYNEASLSTEYYFFKGIMMKSEKDYLSAIEAYETIPNITQLYQALSHYSKYPIIRLSFEQDDAPDTNHERWLLKGKLYTGSFKPKMSERTYVIKNGILHSIMDDTNTSPLYTTEHKPSVIEFDNAWSRNCSVKTTVSNEQVERDDMIDDAYIFLHRPLDRHVMANAPGLFYEIIFQAIGDGIETDDESICSLIDDIIINKTSTIKFLEGEYNIKCPSRNSFAESIKDMSLDEMKKLRNIYMDFQKETDFSTTLGDLEYQLVEIEELADTMSHMADGVSENIATELFTAVQFVKTSINGIIKRAGLDHELLLK